MPNAKRDSKKVFSQKKWQGFSDHLKDVVEPDHYYLAQAIDYRTDPNSITLQPASLKESGNTVTDLLKWADTVPSDLSVYSYGNVGNIYKRTTAGVWTNLRTASNSHGNGLSYFAGDDYIYYTTDSAVGRYGPIAGTPQFNDNFIGSQGGVPQNTYSLQTLSASSQYATAVDSASLSVTGDLTLETYFKANSLPTSGNSMTLMAKWDESGTTKSYKLDLYGVSAYFGDGSDGALTIAADTTEAPVDSACTGTVNTQTLSATNSSFATGQVILIHQTRGSGAGAWERNTIQSYTAGTITTSTPLKTTYVSGAQVRVMKQYTNVTVNSGKTYRPKDWNGTVGGILAFIANGTITVIGTINGNGTAGSTGFPTATGATGGGFRGGTAEGVVSTYAFCGEGTSGASAQQTTANGNGGGGAVTFGASQGFGGGGGGNGSMGSNGLSNDSNSSSRGSLVGNGGNTSGSADLTSMVFGGGGGGGANDGNSETVGSGGSGGAILFLTGVTLTISGAITSNGGNGGGASSDGGGGGAGGGGSILLKAQTATLGTGLITASGGTGGVAGTNNGGGDGGNGRIHLDYLTSYTGTTTPTLNVTQDSSLQSTTVIQARIGISNDGTSGEYLTQTLSNLTTGTWNRLSVTWKASTSMATFYLNAVSLGTFTGTKTAIHDNASAFSVSANKVSAYQNFFDGLQDDARVWNMVLTAAQISQYNQTQLTGNEGGLKAYWKFNNAYTDATANANTLTAVNTPTFSTDVPFPGTSAKLNIDQSYTTTGNTYAIPTAISEASTDLSSFTPTNDPQEGIDLNVSSKGTGNWTVTIHDAQNNVIATSTVANALLPSSGYYEFFFNPAWRIVIGKTYHFHVTSTVNDGTLVSSSNNDLTTGDYHTYYQILVTDTAYHPVIPMLNFMAIGNERYVGKWDGAFYSPNLIAFPTGTHVRCFAYWREYLAIGTWREKSSGTANVYDWTFGRIYFWDGISQTFNFWVDIPEGQINAMFGDNNTLYIMAGYRGDLLVYDGSYQTLNTSAEKLKRIPIMARGDNVEIYPGAISMWRSLLQIGVAGASNSTTILKGGYTWGTLNKLYRETLSLDWPISTGNTGNTVSIGLVYPAGQTLLIGWQDGVGFGCDQVTYTNNPAPYGQIQTLVMDADKIWKQKSPLKLRADYLPLASGESINIGYKVDRETNWENGTKDSTVGSFFNKLEIANGRGREIQYRTELFATGSTSPTLLGLSALSEGLDKELAF